MNFHMLRALRHRNFLLFFAGQGISLVGTWMQQVAMSWFVYQQTKSSFLLSLVLFCGQVPALFLAPLAGVLVDRANRHRLLLLTQSLAMLQAFALAGLALSPLVADQSLLVGSLVILSLFMGVVNTFDMTGRQAFLTEMVTSREDLGNAIALNSSLVNGARLVGPTLAGILLASTSAAICFLANAISYIAVLIALAAMRVTPRPRLHRDVSVLRGLREGFAYAFGFAPIRAILLLLAVVSMAGMSYSVLLPQFTVQVLHGDAHTLGLLTAASGLGALSGALFLASRKSVLGLGRWIMLCPALLGLALMVFGQAQWSWLAMLTLYVIGFAMMVQMAASNTILQTIVAEDKRGRVMSFYTMAFLGMAPIGSLLTGVLSLRLGVMGTLTCNGIACVAAALTFSVWLPRLRALIRPIYVQLEILPEINTGIQTATTLSAVAKE